MFFLAHQYPLAYFKYKLNTAKNNFFDEFDRWKLCWPWPWNVKVVLKPSSKSDLVCVSLDFQGHFTWLFESQTLKSPIWFLYFADHNYCTLQNEKWPWTSDPILAYLFFSRSRLQTARIVIQKTCMPNISSNVSAT